MCFRFLAAVRTPSTFDLRPSTNPPDLPDLPDLTSLGVRCGLDVRAAERGPTSFVEIAWGDCACSLYTQREGRERAVAFVEALAAAGAEVQMLLFSDGEQVDWSSAEPARVGWGPFRAQGLQSLPEGRVATLT